LFHTTYTPVFRRQFSPRQSPPETLIVSHRLCANRPLPLFTATVTAGDTHCFTRTSPWSPTYTSVLRRNIAPKFPDYLFYLFCHHIYVCAPTKHCADTHCFTHMRPLSAPIFHHRRNIAPTLIVSQERRHGHSALRRSCDSHRRRHSLVTTVHKYVVIDGGMCTDRIKKARDSHCYHQDPCSSVICALSAYGLPCTHYHAYPSATRVSSV